MIHTISYSYESMICKNKQILQAVLEFIVTIQWFLLRI